MIAETAFCPVWLNMWHINKFIKLIVNLTDIGLPSAINCLSEEECQRSTFKVLVLNNVLNSIE